MSGHDVKILQDFLERAGFDTSVDGEFGTGTVKSRQAVRDRPAASRPTASSTPADIDLLRSLVDGEAQRRRRPTPPTPAATTPGAKATVGADGLAVAPADAPDQVKQIIAAGNAIAKKPYIYGGGHGKWQDTGYDCSGSVSYALHGAGLLDAPLPSGNFMSWGEKGPGQWVTHLRQRQPHVHGRRGPALRHQRPRRRTARAGTPSSRPSSGYTVVHPPGLCRHRTSRRGAEAAGVREARPPSHLP